MKRKVFIVAGEASADMHAAKLLNHLNRNQEFEAFGVGGENLKSAGMRLIVSAETLNVVGVSDWFNKISTVYRAYKSIVSSIKREKPEVAILLDLPDFNFLIAKKLKALGVPVIYYISPQVWAWRKYRIRKIKKYVDKMLVVFPFEKEFYSRHQVAVDYVGHPLLESIKLIEKNRVQSEVLRAPRIAILPGSRESEIRFHAQLVRDLVVLLKKRYPSAEIEIPIAHTLVMEWVDKEIGSSSIRYTNEKTDKVMEWADIALVASGTATLETALLGVPFCLFYVVSASSGWIFKNIVRYKQFIGMPNILLKEEVAKEFFQDKAKTETVFEELIQLIENEKYRYSKIEKFKQLRSILGEKKASHNAADAVLKMFKTLNYESKPNSQLGIA